MVKSNPKISIIVPIYNTAKYLPACIESIINQTYQNLEILLINDGSTDDSLKIAKSYAKKDSRIKVISKENGGQSSARNLGLKNATGEYISFVDADDEIKPDFIAKLYSALYKDVSLSACGIHYNYLKQKSSADVYIKQVRRRHKNESVKSYILYLLIIDGRMYSSVNKLYRAEFAKKIKFDESINFAEDTKYVLDYISKIPKDPSFVLEPLYIYNSGTATSTMSSTATIWRNWLRAFKNLTNWFGNKATFSDKVRLSLILLRWRISCSRSKRRLKS